MKATSDSSRAFVKLAANLVGETYIEEMPDVEPVKKKIVKKKPKSTPKQTLQQGSEHNPELKQMELKEPEIQNPEQIDENQIQQSQSFEQYKPLSLTAVEEKDINERYNNFIAERETKKPNMWNKIIGFFFRPKR